MRRIHTIGDSHCWSAWLKIPQVEIHFRGPMLMHSFGRDKPVVISDIPVDEPVVFCYGEIDCWCHVHKYQPWRETIEKIVDSYYEALKINEDINKNIMMFNVVPPPRRSPSVSENPNFPFLGTDEERLLYVQYMNSRLAKLPYFFIDVYKHYADKDGFLRTDMSDGNVHIADERPLQLWLEENVL